MMERLLQPVVDLFSSQALILIGVTSALCFVGTLIAIPFILVRLPHDYFDERYPRSWMRDHHPVLRLFAHLGKNLVGAVFLLAGLAMLVLPGQGILTILIGLSLIDFPGKRRLEAKLIGQQTVLRTVNAMRHRFGRPPLTIAPSGNKSDLPGVGRQPTTSVD